MLICVCDLTIIGSDNGLAPTRINTGILLIRPLGTNFSEIQNDSPKHNYLAPKQLQAMSLQSDIAAYIGPPVIASETRSNTQVYNQQ